VKNSYLTWTLASVVLIAVFAFGLPQYGVYTKSLSGKAQLQEAEFTRQVAVLEAKAKLDSWRIFVRGDRPDAVNDGPLSLFLARWGSGWRMGDPIPARYIVDERSSLSGWDKKSL
jgi:acetyl esterase/lipase